MKLWDENIYTDGTQEENLFKMIIFGHNELPILDDHPYDGSNRFFIIGIGRTGTTALRNLVSLYNDVWCANEANFVFSILNLITTTCVVPFPGKPRGIVMWNVDRRENRMWPPEEKYVWKASELREICEVWFEKESIRNNANIIGDKSSAYLDMLPILRKVFPKCKFLMTVRNPLDWLSSYFDQSWNIVFSDNCSKESLDKINSLFWFIWEKEKIANSSNDILTINFEDICKIDSLIEVNKNITNFLNVEKQELSLEKFVKNDVVGKWKNDERVTKTIEKLIIEGYNLPPNIKL